MHRLGPELTLLLLLPSVCAAGSAEAGDAAAVLAAASNRALAKLADGASDGSAVDPDALMRVNLSPYFVTYPVPEGSEQERVLRTAERIAAGFAREILDDAAARGAAAGAAAIAPEAVAEAIRDRLHARRTPFDTMRFFTHRGEGHVVVLELVDLEALRDTGFPWRVIGGLAGDAARLSALPTLQPAAVPLLADALTSYGLLVLRLAGESARRELAAVAASPHLREAEKRLRALAGDAPLPPPAEPAPAADDRFADVTAASDVGFRHVSSRWLARFRRYGPSAPTFSGGGVTAADLDGDRLPDLVFCGGRGCAFFRNAGGGRFRDETARSGLVAAGEARMAVAADLDNDGDSDVLVTYAHDPSRLFENLGDARFRDVTERSGLAREGDVTGAAVAFDADNDGLLDLYLANFGDYLSGAAPWNAPDARNGQPNRLFRNEGGLRFSEIGEAAGVADPGWAQAVAAADLDGDGWQDLYVANDFGRNELFRNRGDGTFEAAGAAWGADDRFHGMNVAFADLNRDRAPEILVTNIWGWSPAREAPEEHNTLLVSKRTAAGWRYEATAPASFVETDSGWAWAALFFDQDHDGDDDVFLVNGHSDYAVFIQYRRHPREPDRHYPIHNGREANLFFPNEGGVLGTPSAGTAAALPEENSRGLALLDYDADGDLDMAVSTFHSRGRLFANRGGDGSWLVLELEGDPARGASRDAVGAQVVVRGPDGLEVWRSVTAGEGYLSQSARPVHVGLGSAREVDVEVRWPGGGVDRYERVAVNRWLAIRQGDAEPRALPRPGASGP